MSLSRLLDMGAHLVALSATNELTWPRMLFEIRCILLRLSAAIQCLFSAGS